MFETHPKEVIDFVNFVKQECKKHGVKADIRKVKYLKLSGNIQCSGYFDENDKKLVVAGRHPMWLETLVHEYCHLTQWVEQCPAWTNMGSGVDEVDKWLGGEDVEDIDGHINKVRDMELDNEKRSLQTILKWNLPINAESYVKKANAYVYFYTWIKGTRRWSTPSNSPYSNPRVIEVMPPTFDNDYNILPDSIRKAFIEQKI